MLVKKKATPSREFGKNPFERSVEELLKCGVVIVDKPKGPTSQQTMTFLKQILEIDKAGYSGTLDPKVTGVLPCGLNSASRLLRFLLDYSKEYVCIMHLHSDIDGQVIKSAVNSFVGNIRQKVPRRSAVKVQVRPRTVHSIKLIEIDGRRVLFRAVVQSGTYMRMLCHDIGVKLGCGAHMLCLRRISVANLSEDYCVTLDELKMALHELKNGDESFFRRCVLPVEVLVSGMKKVVVLDSAVSSICHGANLKVPGVSSVDGDLEVGEHVAVFTLKGELVGVGSILMPLDDLMKKSEGVFANVHTIVMNRDVYPAVWKSDKK